MQQEPFIFISLADLFPQLTYLFPYLLDPIVDDVPPHI